MKKINYILSLLVIAFTISCDSDTDNLAPVADLGGVVMNTSISDGAILGVPNDASDLDNSEIAFNATYLDFDVRLNLGNEAGISKYEIVKTFNGGDEVIVGETASLPFNLSYTTLDEYLDGTGVIATDLRIGDKFTFKVKIYQNDGDVYYYSPNMGQFSVTVNCSSDLEGTYLVSYTGGDFPHVITEITPGIYEMSSMFGWPDAGYVTGLSDTCGVVTFTGWQWANGLEGTGQVQPNGDIIFTEVGVEDVYSGNTYTMVKQ